MKKIQDYLDYRHFLKDYYEEKNRENNFFSYRFIGQRVGIDASHLVKIFQGKRHIGDSSIEAFSRFLHFNKSDSEYFTTLVKFNKARSDREIKLWYERLLASKSINSHVLGRDQYEFYQKWYYTAVLMCLDFYRFNGDYKELSKMLSPEITVKEAKNAVELLERLELIKKLDDGSYYLTNEVVTTGDKCRSVAVRSYQEESIDLARQSLDRHQKEVRDISTVAMTINKKDLESIKEQIKEFRSKLLRHATECQDPDAVYQLNLQFIPLTQ